MSDEELLNQSSQALACVCWPAVSDDGIIETGSSLGVYQALEAGCPMILASALSGSGPVHPSRAAVISMRDVTSIVEAMKSLFEDWVRVGEMATAAWLLFRERSCEAPGKQLISELEA